MLYQLQSVLQKRTFRYYNFWLLRYGILTVSPASSFSSRTCFIRQNGMFSAIEKIIVSKGSFFIQSLNKLTPEFSPTHFILRKSYIKGKENKFGFIFCLWLHKSGTYTYKGKTHISFDWFEVKSQSVWKLLNNSTNAIP